MLPEISKALVELALLCANPCMTMLPADFQQGTTQIIVINIHLSPDYSTPGRVKFEILDRHLLNIVTGEVTEIDQELLEILTDKSTLE